MKKYIFPFIFLLSYSQQVFGQEYSTLVVQVVDSKTKTPLEDAIFTFEETGFQKGVSDKDGKIVFIDSAPIGRIHYTVTRNDYLIKQAYFNITKESDNTLVVSLVKERKKDADKILIAGEITSVSGKELINAQVEVRIANIIERVNTDISGNYSVEVDLSKVLYETDQIIIEAKQGNCRTTEIISFSAKNYLSADIKLDCKAVNDSINPSRGDLADSNKSIWLGHWITEYEADGAKYVLEISKENENKFIGVYQLDNNRKGTVIFNRIETSLISGFWIVRNNGHFESCGEVVLTLGSPGEFRGYYTELHQSNNDNRHSWIGKR